MTEWKIVKGEYSIGVVIPAKNEERFIQKVVETLPDFVDIAIVVNDGSTDRTLSLVENMDSLVELHCISLNGEGVGLRLMQDIDF